MNHHQLTLFAGSLGGQLSGGTTRFHKTPCLLAHWRHDEGIDKNPSAAISTDEPHVFTCFSCGASHRLFELVYEVNRLNKIDPAPFEINFNQALEIAMQEDDPDPTGLSFDPSSMKGYEDAQLVGPQPWPEEHINNFEKAYDHWYVKQRGVPHWLAELLDIRFDPYYQRICFPIRDFAGQFMGLHGRALDPNNELRYFSYGYMNQRNPEVMIGEQLVDGSRPVIVTEGMFDLTSIMQVYPNVLATKSCSIGKNMMRRLSEFPTIITAFDTGKGGNTGRQAIELAFDHKKPIVHMIPSVKYGDYGATPIPQIHAQVGQVYQALS